VAEHRRVYEGKERAAEHSRAYEVAMKLDLLSVYWRCPYAGRQSLSLLLQRK
jgi:hypothetical protein